MILLKFKYQSLLTWSVHLREVQYMKFTAWRRIKWFIYASFLDAKKAYDMIQRNDLWYKMSKMGIKCKTWRVVRSAYGNNRSCIFWKVGRLNFSQLRRGLPKVVLCCLFLILHYLRWYEGSPFSKYISSLFMATFLIKLHFV